MRPVYVPRKIMRRFTRFLGFSVYPVMVIRSDYKNSAWLLAHERWHYDRQREVGTVKWLFKYFTDRKFKRREEISAHIAAVQAGQDIGEAAAQLAQNYDLDIGYGEAVTLLMSGVLDND